MSPRRPNRSRDWSLYIQDKRLSSVLFCLCYFVCVTCPIFSQHIVTWYCLKDFSGWQVLVLCLGGVYLNDVCPKTKWSVGTNEELFHKKVNTYDQIVWGWLCIPNQVFSSKISRIKKTNKKTSYNSSIYSELPNKIWKDEQLASKFWNLNF